MFPSNYNYDLPSFALGLGVGLVAPHVINSRAREQAINKVERAAKLVYNNLTVSNALAIAFTCLVGSAITHMLVIPSIGLFKETVTHLKDSITS